MAAVLAHCVFAVAAAAAAVSTPRNTDAAAIEPHHHHRPNGNDTVRPVVVTSCGGRVVGSEPDVDGVVAFLGIPYAAPPLGELRWQPPVPFCGNSTLVADDPGPMCPQKGMTTLPNASEDCLVLHVWAPAEAVAGPSSNNPPPALLPVVVYLHGGSLVEGSAVVRACVRACVRAASQRRRAPFNSAIVDRPRVP
jgi:hypothetical protein